MKILDRPLHIHRRTVEQFSDWTDWTQHRIPEFRHVGARPMLDGYPRDIGSGNPEYFWYSDRVLDQLIRNEPVIFVMKQLDPHQLESIRRAFVRCQPTQPRLLVASGSLPGEWPAWVRIVTCPTNAYLFSLHLDQSGMRPQYKKQMDSVTHALGVMAGTEDQGRPHLIQMMARLGLLPHCLVGTPEIAENSTARYSPDTWAINNDLPRVPEHRIGNQYHRFNLDENFPVLMPEIERCRVWISMDNNPLMPGRAQDVSEKMLWGTATGTPCLGIWHDSAAAEMKHWGFDMDHESTRKSDETAQEAVMRWCGRILLLHRMTQDPEWCQRWYDTQAPRVAHNSGLTRRLHLVIRQHLQRQWDELPREWARLI